ncbi:MAG: hypothetical protein IJV37_01180 [Bacteroidales bacterium]|nr:hypothetical protein [Bacteroidales bacterium]
MNNLFDIKRFGNYFLYDLRRAKNNYGLSLLVIGLTPVMLFVFYLFFALIGSHTIEEMPEELHFLAAFVTVFIVILGAGTKIYGFVTRKRAGSDFLMLPASTFEKWLSMGLIVCIVLPVVFFTLLFGSDSLLSLLFPNAYGASLLSQQWDPGLFEAMEDSGIYFNLPGVMFLQWCTNILVFTLGAVCFKKNKVAKTLFCIFGVSVVLSTLAMLFFGHAHFGPDWFTERIHDPDRMLNSFNWTLSIIYTVVIGGLLGGLYYRLRTLKH